MNTQPQPALDLGIAWVATSFACAMQAGHRRRNARQRPPDHRWLELQARLPGKVVRTRVNQGAPLDSYVYVPERAPARAGTLISVHGVTRRAQEQFSQWAPFADRLQLTLVAPRFGRRDFPGYQRLGGARYGVAADTALLRLMEFLRSHGQMGPGPVFLFGYSGGAQFVHRFLLAHPHAADGAVVAAAGWYTFPDSMTPFPYGLATVRAPLASHLDVFLRKPILVAVGEADVERDHQLRRRTWMDAWQGRTRVERAERWVDALRAAARRRSIATGISICRLPGAGHSFGECMQGGLGWQAGMFLADHTPLRGEPRGDV